MKPETVGSGARALVAALVDQGVRYLFGIPGVHTLPLFDALADYPELTPVVTRHEAGATFAADGYARVSGRPGVVSVVPGPGALNAATSVLCAHSDRVPMVVLTAELESDPNLSAPRQAVVHEGDLAAIYRPFTKLQVRLSSVEDIAVTIHRALQTALTPPMGPVHVLVPLSVLTQRGTPRPAPDVPAETPESIESLAAEVCTFLTGCRSPVLLFGMELRSMAVEAQALAERLGAPAFTDVGARGLIPEDHPLAAGLLPWQSAQAVLDAADGMLVLGSRLSEITTLNWSRRIPARLARVDADETQLTANYPASLPIHADPRAMLQKLAGSGRGELYTPSATSGETDGRGVHGHQNAAAQALTESRYRNSAPTTPAAPYRIHPRAAVQALRAALPRDAIVVTDATATEFWLSEESFPILAPAGFLLPEVQQTMGYALAGAVGAAIAVAEAGSDRPVVCVSGDGSLQMMLGELATAATLGHQLTVVIFEDGYYNALRIYQDGLYGRQVGVKLTNPDFVALARAYGAPTVRVDAVDALSEAVAGSMRVPGLSVVVAAIDPAPLPERYARRLQQMAPADSAVAE